MQRDQGVTCIFFQTAESQGKPNAESCASHYMFALISCALRDGVGVWCIVWFDDDDDDDDDDDTL